MFAGKKRARQEPDEDSERSEEREKYHYNSMAPQKKRPKLSVTQPAVAQHQDKDSEQKKKPNVKRPIPQSMRNKTRGLAASNAITEERNF